MVNLQKTSQDSGGLGLLVAGSKEMLGRVLGSTKKIQGNWQDKTHEETGNVIKGKFAY